MHAVSLRAPEKLASDRRQLVRHHLKQLGQCQGKALTWQCSHELPLWLPIQLEGKPKDKQDCCKLAIKILFRKLIRFSNHTVRMQASRACVEHPYRISAKCNQSSWQKIQLKKRKYPWLHLRNMSRWTQKRLDDCTSALHVTATHKNPCNRCLSGHKLHLQSKRVLLSLLSDCCL